MAMALQCRTQDHGEFETTKQEIAEESRATWSSRDAEPAAPKIPEKSTQTNKREAQSL